MRLLPTDTFLCVRIVNQACTRVADGLTRPCDRIVLQALSLITDGIAFSCDGIVLQSLILITDGIASSCVGIVSQALIKIAAFSCDGIVLQAFFRIADRLAFVRETVNFKSIWACGFTWFTSASNRVNLIVLYAFAATRYGLVAKQTLVTSSCYFIKLI